MQVLSALAAAHAHDILHRDVKPANVFLTPTAAGFDFVKLLDFGIAGNLTGHVSTRTPGLAGTPAYMAPEQIRGAVLDARTDVWAAGVCLYEMLSGKLPFEGNSIPTLLANIGSFAPAPLAGIDPALAAVVERALAKAPKDRFASADAMRAALAPLAAVGAVPSRDLVGPKTRVLERAETVPMIPHDSGTASFAETVRDPASADDRALYVSTRGVGGNTLASGAAHTIPEAIAPSAPPPGTGLLALLNVVFAGAAVAFTAFLLLPRAAPPSPAVEDTRPRCAFATPVTWKTGVAELRLASDGTMAVLAATTVSPSRRKLAVTPYADGLELASITELDAGFDSWPTNGIDAEVQRGEQLFPCATFGGPFLAGGVRARSLPEPRSTFVTSPPRTGPYPYGLEGHSIPYRVLATDCATSGSYRVFAASVHDPRAPRDLDELMFYASQAPAIHESLPNHFGRVRAFRIAAAPDVAVLALATDERLAVGFMDRVALAPRLEGVVSEPVDELALAASSQTADIVWHAKTAPELRAARLGRQGGVGPVEVLAHGDVSSPALASSSDGYTLAWLERGDGQTWVHAGTGPTPARAARDASTFAVPASTRSVLVGPGKRPWVAWVEGDVAQVSRLACIR